MKQARSHLFKISVAVSACALLLIGFIVGGWLGQRQGKPFGSAASAALTPSPVDDTAQSDAAIKVPGDYDGDGDLDEAVWHPADGTWVIQQSSGKQTRSIVWGMNGDVPVPNDFDGDHKTDVAVWRPSDGVWYVIQSASNTPNLHQWGERGDTPFAADYDEDGKLDLAVWRPTENAFLILRSSDGTQMRRDGQQG